MLLLGLVFAALRQRGQQQCFTTCLLSSTLLPGQQPGSACDAPPAAVSVRDVRALGEALAADPVGAANNAVTLLGFVQDARSPEHVCRAAMSALKLFWAAQHDEGGLSQTQRAHKLDEQSAEAVYAAWLSRQYAAFVAALLSVLGRASASLRVAAVSALMECARHEAGPACFSSRLCGQLLLALLTNAQAQPEALALLVSKYLPCLDVRHCVLRTIARLAQQRAVRGETAGGTAGSDDEADADQLPVTAGRQQPDLEQGTGARSNSDVARAMFDVLAAVQPLPTAAAPGESPELLSWCGAAEAGLVTAAADAAASAKQRRKRKVQALAAGGAVDGAGDKQQLQPFGPGTAAVAWANPKLQQRAYSAAWLAFLRMELPADIYRKVLIKLHSDVMPGLLNPLLLCDFLSHALDRGGLEGMLALNGIFRLVTRHGLEYPRFYARLYCLIEPAAFLAKQRVQFFGLADIFLASGMVPAYTAASFAKRLARLALTAPPAGAMLAIGLVHNVIRRHPACMLLLHKPSKQSGSAGGDATAAGDGGEAAAASADVFDATEPDPAKTRAVESSLWELAALRNHYCPQVASMVGCLDKDLADRLRTSELDIQPLLPASYASLLAHELGRKLRRGVAVAFYASQPAGLFDAGLLGDDLAGWELGS